ncbi:hypothetical protein GGR21_000310 [Dysgonomonas hofstadii]|uniref:Uncharacterized protein n=1 Tax=Dysgonomonas hofstadii TaxID=637886 RepID=A0A840CN49_9BACT|nr:hypothetical protein [Dysgonomonas hofstadii]
MSNIVFIDENKKKLDNIKQLCFIIKICLSCKRISPCDCMIVMDTLEM